MAARSVFESIPIVRPALGVAMVVVACSHPQPEGPPARAEPAPGAADESSVGSASAPTVAVADTPAPTVAVADIPALTRPRVEATPESSKSPTLAMTFVGDVIFGRYREQGYDPIPEDGFAVFAPMADALASDLLIGNLETPLVSVLPPTSPIGSKFAFGASKEHAALLVDGGFDAVSLANNHWYDQRLEGVEQTPAILEELGIVPLGAPTLEPDVFRVEAVEAKGWRVGVVAFTNRSNAPQREGVPVLPFLSAREVAGTVGPVVAAARDEFDLVIAFVHWGEENVDGPSMAQRKAAHALIDAGAALVIGHHPHVLQGAELYGDGLIVYSLGNFLFENTTEPARLTGVLRVVMQAGCRQEVRFHPAYVKRRPVQHPTPASGYMGRKVRERVRLVSRRFETEWDDVERPDGVDLRLRDPGACGPA